MLFAVAGLGDAGPDDGSFCRDHRSRLQQKRSCEFNQIAPLQIRQGFIYISSNRRPIRLVFFG
jgi:hypothetical protein